MNTQTATRKMCVLQISLVLLSVLALPTMLVMYLAAAGKYLRLTRRPL
jgi:hypothetical protein